MRPSDDGSHAFPNMPEVGLRVGGHPLRCRQYTLAYLAVAENQPMPTTFVRCPALSRLPYSPQGARTWRSCAAMRGANGSPAGWRIRVHPLRSIEGQESLAHTQEYA